MLIPVSNYDDFCSVLPSFWLSVCKHEAFLSFHAQESSKIRLGVMFSRTEQPDFSSSLQTEFHQQLSTHEMLDNTFFPAMSLTESALFQQNNSMFTPQTPKLRNATQSNFQKGSLKGICSQTRIQQRISTDKTSERDAFRKGFVLQTKVHFFYTLTPTKTLDGSRRFHYKFTSKNS